MTKSKSLSLAAIGLATVIVAILVVVLVRTGVLPGPEPPEEAQYNPVTKVSLGMTLDELQRLRPKAKYSPDIDEEQGKEWKAAHPNYSIEYMEFDPEIELNSSYGREDLPHFMAWYHFKYKELDFFMMSWNVSGKEALSAAASVVKRARARYGKEDEQAIREVRGSRPTSTPNLGVELLWRRDAMEMQVAVGPGLGVGSTVISCAAIDHSVPSNPHDPPLVVSEVEKLRVFEKYGIPPLSK